MDLVECSNRDLKEFPLDLPKSTRRLLLNDNKITRVPALGLFNRLPKLQSLDLARNKIEVIEEGAFEGAHSILEIVMSENKIRQVNGALFRVRDVCTPEFKKSKVHFNVNKSCKHYSDYFQCI